MANSLSAEPAHLLVVFLVVPAVARIHPQTGSLVAAGHACACPLIGLLAAATQACPSLFVVVAAVSRARTMPRSLPRAPMPQALRWWLPQPCLQVRCWQCLRWGQVRHLRPTMCPLVHAPQRPRIQQPSCVPMFLAAWTGLRPTPLLHPGVFTQMGQLQDFKTRFDSVLYGGSTFARCNAMHAGVEQQQNRKRVRGTSICCCKLYMMCNLPIYGNTPDYVLS